MPKKVPYAIQTRNQICKSNVNESTAKVLWSFTKNNRFPQAKPVCPHSSYQYDLSTIGKHDVSFGLSKRKVFTEVSEGPSSWKYNVQNKKKSNKQISFAQPRENCPSNSYLSFSVYKNPGPGQYISGSSSKKRGISMRPKTAHQKNYFIDNKQLKSVPGPTEYNLITSKDGVSVISKFKNTTMGACLQAKQERFKALGRKYVLIVAPTPSPNHYHPIKLGINKFSKNGKIGTTRRKSFIDDTVQKQFTPGPGNYLIPTEFAHYSNFKRSKTSFQ